MLVHSLRLLNFKSYLGEHILGPFDPHFTCIIGPNGNGKSNILDALLFVFGFRSAKLRQDSLSSLIHFSALAHPESCEVTVTFREQTEMTEVSRHVHQGGSNQYRLNGEKISWGRLRETLMAKKIDLAKNLFIILQGEVERLCELSPAKLIEHIQYVCGSDCFLESIAELEGQFLANSTMKTDTHIQLSMKRRSVEQAAIPLRTHAKWLFSRFKLFLIQHILLNKQFSQLEGERDFLKEQQLKEEGEREKIEKELKSLKNQLRGIKEQKQSIEVQINKAEEALKSGQGRMERGGVGLKDLKRKLAYAVRDKQGEEEQMEKWQSEIVEMQGIVAQEEEIHNQFARLSASIKVVKDFNRYRLCCELEEKEVTLRRKVTELHNRLEEAKRHRANVEERMSERQCLEAERGNEKLNLKRAVKCAVDELAMLEKKMEDCSSSLSSLKGQAGDCSDRMDMKAVEVQKRATSGRTLRDYVTIKENEDIVETIMPQLDNFLVESQAEALCLMNTLKKNQLGRATVIIKQLVRKLNIQIPAGNVPPNTTRLFDLCKASTPEISHILYWILGETLLVPTLDSAMHIAYGPHRRRIITLKGEFIDLTGTITHFTLKQPDPRDVHRKLQVLKQEKESIGREQEKCRSILRLSLTRIAEIERKEEVERENEQNQGNEANEVDLRVERYERELKECEMSLGEMSLSEMSLSEMSLSEIKMGELKGSLPDYEERMREVRAYETWHGKIKRLNARSRIADSLSARIADHKAKAAQYNGDICFLKVAVDTAEEQLRTQKAEIQKQQEALLESKSKHFGLEKRHLSTEMRVKQLSRGNIVSKVPQKLAETKDKMAEAKMHHRQSLTEIEQLNALIRAKICIPCAELLPQGTGWHGQDHSWNYNPPLMYLGDVQVCFNQLLNFEERHCLRIAGEEDSILLESIDIRKWQVAHAVEQQKIDRIDCCLTLQQIDFSMFEDYSQLRQASHRMEVRYEQLCLAEARLTRQLIGLRKQRLTLFLEGFNCINIALGGIYRSLTGGWAELSLTDSLNPFEGVEFSVRPLNKSWKSVNLLSGGEKTLTSLALIFACEDLRRLPFYFLDQIDAALDYRNTSLLAAYIRGKPQTQYIVISLRKNMYQECNLLAGVYKVRDSSNIVQQQRRALQ